MLKQGASALHERDVVVLDIKPDAVQRERSEHGVDTQAAFKVLLVGKDGTVTLQRDEPMDASEISLLIDKIPRRQGKCGARQKAGDLA